ncbi:ribonuclease E/G [Candidatus Clostridium radicumherbarum]|uniref:Ribonuclease E/G n=1 Tax=Candidatus Clostridium radicumherbarum TaxID=3381662 RepID=A0ABW8TRH0_9CLOT
MKELFIERRERLLRIAIRNMGKLEECYIEEENNEPKQGEIYRGIVKNIVPAIKCAFLDIGFGKNCYMYLDRKFNNTNIKKNDELVVEVLKEGIGDKGPKITNAFSIPGRYVVLETLYKEIRFSSKIQSEEFKKAVLDNIPAPKDLGLKIRTNAEKVSIDRIKEEIERLLVLYNNILNDFNLSSKPKLLYGGEGILDKVLRDKLDLETDKIIINNEKDYKYIKDILKHNTDVQCTVELYAESRTLFDYSGIEKEILSLRNSRVFLKNGGFIVIDKTEGMYVIDVNSGKNIKSSSLEKTAYETNLEAAYEIGKQIKLRNLSGIIIVDFIDMTKIAYKEDVFTALKKAFESDKNKTVVYNFTELNLIQIARKRIGRPILEYLEEDCIKCSGKGKKLKFSYMIELIRNEIYKIDNSLNIDNVYIEVSSSYMEEINKDIEGFINSIEAQNKKVFLSYVQNKDFIKVEPLIFSSEVEKMQKFKIYG